MKPGPLWISVNLVPEMWDPTKQPNKCRESNGMCHMIPYIQSSPLGGLFPLNLSP